MTLESLKAQRDDIDRQIAAKKLEAIADIKRQMAELGLTVADLSPSAPSHAPSKRAVKYLDTLGHTWTGVGQRPRWLKAAMAAGAELESFRVKAK